MAANDESKIFCGPFDRQPSPIRQSARVHVTVAYTAPLMGIAAFNGPEEVRDTEHVGKPRELATEFGGKAIGGFLNQVCVGTLVVDVDSKILFFHWSGNCQAVANVFNLLQRC